MSNSSKEMFSIPYSHIVADEVIPFSLFLYFSRNNHFIRYRFAGDTVELNVLNSLQNKGVIEFWVLEEERQSYLDFLNRKLEVEKTNLSDDVSQSAQGDEVEYQEKKSSAEEVFPETDLVREVFQNTFLSNEEKEEILSNVSKDLLDSFSKVASTDDSEKSEGLKKCRQITDEILVLASRNSNIYDEIIFIRQSQEDLEHSIVVSTLSAMFALAWGIADMQLVGDIVIAALFHDLGISKVNPVILQKHSESRTANERVEYESHISESIELLKSMHAELTPLVFDLIQDHHENFDGSGFPNGKRGSDISTYSYLLHLANWFDRLCCGKVTNQCFSPQAAFKYIHKTAVSKDSVKEVCPKVIEKIFDFMLDQKQAHVEKVKIDAMANAIVEAKKAS